MAEIVPWDDNMLRPSAELLLEKHRSLGEYTGIESTMSVGDMDTLLRGVLDKNISSALAVLEEGALAGFALAVIENTPHWGKQGRLDSFAWYLPDGMADELGFLYGEIAKKWVESNIAEHVLVIPASSGALGEKLADLGFGRQQIHGWLDGRNFSPEHRRSGEQNSLTVRKSTPEDREQIRSFSRLIALYQKESPCFAVAPESYLTNLDQGFSILTTDEEVELYVIEEEGKILGYQLYAPHEKEGFLSPAGSCELAVSAVTEGARGRGIGRRLTSEALRDQLCRGREIFITDWRSANLLSSRFWPRVGFRPLAYRMVRVLAGLPQGS